MLYFNKWKPAFRLLFSQSLSSCILNSVISVMSVTFHTHFFLIYAYTLLNFAVQNVGVPGYGFFSHFFLPLSICHPKVWCTFILLLSALNCTLCKLICLHSLRELSLPMYVQHYQILSDFIKQLQVIHLIFILYFAFSEIYWSHYTISLWGC